MTTPVSTTHVNPKFDAYLTWRDYDGSSNPDGALYILNGAEAGRGYASLENAVRQLPDNSTILVYPAYHWMAFSAGSYKSPPYSAHSTELQKLALEKGLKFIASDFDQEGKYVGPPGTSTF